MHIDYTERDLDSLKTYHISPNETRVTHSERMRRKAVFYDVDRVERIVNKNRSKSIQIGTHTFYYED
tara:strand:- start:293 stop:493 length:201 start_codon:yes stop_codon:yes gene_type:complete